MKHTPEPWRLGPVGPSRTHTQISGEGWSSFASVVTKMASEENLSEQGVANAQRIIDCVNAMAGIENPEEFVRTAKTYTNAEMSWEKLMMELVGADEPRSVRDAIEKLKESKPSTTLTETDRDNLCDMLWWMKGYKKGADDNFENCPFAQYHLDTLDKVVKEMREILDKK